MVCKKDFVVDWNLKPFDWASTVLFSGTPGLEAPCVFVFPEMVVWGDRQDLRELYLFAVSRQSQWIRKLDQIFGCRQRRAIYRSCDLPVKRYAFDGMLGFEGEFFRLKHWKKIWESTDGFKRSYTGRFAVEKVPCFE